MNTIKKRISIILTILFVISSFTIGNLSSFAAETATVYSDEINAEAGNTVTIPIYIKNNSGLLGWSLVFDYDSAVLEPVSISAGDDWAVGLLNDTITGKYATNGQFKAIYQQGTINNNTSNGILMYAEFSVALDAVGSTNITVSYEQDNTYDADFIDVELNCQNIVVNFTNSTYDNAPKLKVSSADIIAGDEFNIDIEIKDINNLTQLMLSVSYDSDNFEFISCESNDLADVSYEYESGCLIIKAENLSAKIDGGILCTLTLKCDDFAYEGAYEILPVYTELVGADTILITKGTINVSASETSNSAVISSDSDLKADYGQIVSVPLYINHNKGMYAYGLILSYDNACLKPVSVNYTSDFSGSIISNIGRYDDHINIMWNKTENVFLNGKFLVVEFEILTDESDKTTTIYVDYSQEDTCNEAGEDVQFICNDVDILLNHIPVVTDLTLKSNPDKLTYELFEEFDGTGMVIEAEKDDGSIETITDYIVTGFETNSVGTKTVVISYGGKSVSFDIEVSHNHTWGEWETVSSPNCVDKGSEKRVCSVCKETEMRDVDPLGHTWESDFTVDVEPTCELAGSKSIHCSRCDVIKDSTPIEPMGHNYTSSVTKAATCTEDGIRTYVCQNDASHTYTEVIPKLGHNYVASVTKQPSCEEEGIKTFICSNDSSHTYTEEIQAIGHDFELTEIIKPTCTEDGKEIYTCKNDSSHTKEVVLKATGHSPSGWIIDKNPTYLECGSRHTECTVCKTVLNTESISMLDDITAPEIEIKVKDNSFKSFLNNISFGLFFKENIDITIIAEDSESGVEKIEYIKTDTPISENDIALQTEWIIGDKLTVSDEEEFIIYVKATDKQGNISYAGTDGMIIDKTAPVINGIDNNAVYCQPVSFTVSDKYIEKVLINGAEALAEAGKYTLTADESEYEIVVVDKAGNETAYNVTVNNGHTYSDWIIDNPADCTNNGEKHRVCSFCGHREDAVITALGHSYSETFITDIEPTCTTEGEKSKHCMRCDSKSEIKVIDALGHTFDEWETIVSPDCTNSGSRQRVCMSCGFTETENLNASGHNWNSDYTVDIPATCTTDGSKSIHCANCDAVKDSQVISATGHSLGEYKVIKQATCIDNGIEERICADCDYSEKREIPALGHDYAEEFMVDKSPTCTENGEKSKHCSRCDSKSEITVISATGHSGGIASCHSGSICDICGAEYGELDLSNHDGETEIRGYIAPTVDDFGYTGDTYCKSCGAKLADGEQIEKLPSETNETEMPTEEITTTDNVDDSNENSSNISQSTQKSDNGTTGNTNKNTSKTSPATGSITALPIAVSTAFAISLACIIKKRKED